MKDCLDLVCLSHYLDCLKWCSKAQPEGGQHHAQVWGFEQCNSRESWLSTKHAYALCYWLWMGCDQLL